MPLTDLHKKRRVKNFAVLGALVIFMVILFVITLIRLSPDGAAG